MALFTIIDGKIYVEHSPLIFIDVADEDGEELSKKRDAKNPKVMDK